LSQTHIPLMRTQLHKRKIPKYWVRDNTVRLNLPPLPLLLNVSKLRKIRNKNAASHSSNKNLENSLPKKE
jgi:hypothetical protein